MVVRHSLFAGLFATASLANAGLVEPAASAPKASPWSFNAGPSQAGPADSIGAMQAGSANWSANNRMGDRAATSTMLFSQRTVGVAAAPSAAIDAPAIAAPAIDAPSAAAPVISAPATAAEIVAAAPGVSADAGASAGANAGLQVGPAAVDVPEPATGALMLAGLLGAGALSRRRRK